MSASASSDQKTDTAAERSPCPFRAVLFDWKGTLEPKTAEKRADKKGKVKKVMAEIHEEIQKAGFEGDIHSVHAEVEQSSSLQNKQTLFSESLERMNITQSDPLLARRLHDLYLEAVRNPQGENRALFDGARELLERLKRSGVPVGLIRNSRLPKDVFVKNLEEAGVSHLFDSVVMSGDVGHEKPAPQIFRHAASSLGLDHVLDSEPHTILFVGNETEADIKGAKSVGWKAALVKSTEPHSHGHADYEVHTMAELEKILFPDDDQVSRPPPTISITPARPVGHSDDEDQQEIITISH